MLFMAFNMSITTARKKKTTAKNPNPRQTWRIVNVFCRCLFRDFKQTRYSSFTWG